jgi:polyhydroxyalkanoate synthesis regulator phasin
MALGALPCCLRSHPNGGVSMIEQLKKALTTGLGLALRTWTEAEAVGKEMIRKAQLSEKDANQFLKSLKQTYEKTQKKMDEQVNRLVKDLLKKADIATSDEIKSLKREIQSLKKELRAAKSNAGNNVSSKSKPSAQNKPGTKTAS